MKHHPVYTHERGGTDWLLERGTALVLMFLIPWLGLHLAFLPGLNQGRLVEWVHSPWNAIALASLIVMAALHAGLGIRSILMDYIATPSLRGLSLLITRILLVFSSVTGLGALWVLHTGVAP
jgi:succinate dehydrogenase / fumarate reductase membrane anchor subunit